MPDRHLPAVRPLTARSVAISALLGYHPPELPVSALVKIGALFDIADRTMRVALTRMVSDGDVVTENGVYRLTDRLIRRQAHQEASCSPTPKQWNGKWEVAIVTTPARPLSDRIALRKSMSGVRFAELREGVWTRPANLLQQFDDTIDDQCLFLEGCFGEDSDIVNFLWDLPAWALEARRLLSALNGAESLKSGFIVNAEVFRHLLADPCLPPELLPADWPGDELRRHFADFNADYARRLRDYSRS